MNRQVVSYIRVSTARHARFGLALEAQRAAVEAFCLQHGYETLAEYQEIESGGKNERPVLRQALSHAKARDAVLLFARIDRLARNIAVIAKLIESGAEFRACDMPEANSSTLHAMAVAANEESTAISRRTRVALKAAKERGTRLGASNPACRNLTDDARLMGAECIKKAARKAYADVAPTVQALMMEGLSLCAIARKLNADGHTTRNGREWSAVQVRRVLQYSA